MEILKIHGKEQSLVDPSMADAGLPPAVGVQSWQVFRASHDVPEKTDGKGWTYHHHVDMACWKGRIYVGWNSCERDEDVWPARELYSSSVDGSHWTEPAEMFPQGISTCLRMYFFVAPNGRMLAIAGLRADQDNTEEDKKGGLVVREIRADHTWGEVFTLQSVPAAERRPPMFSESPDAEFKEACAQLLADKMFLEQQDRGRLLRQRRMKWHDAAAWPGGTVPGDGPKWVCGKAFSFFQRPDGKWVGVSKMGWTTISADGGETWDQPIVPPTLVTGKAKVWSQRTADGKFALVFNPSKRSRYPLIVVTGENGTDFDHMRIVQGELPVQRYAGMHRSIGPQYVRGISHWSNDGSRSDAAMWLVYSMNKEDIWVSRVPLPVRADGLGDWNTYCPKWATLKITDDRIQMQSKDPYDYASATRVLNESPRVSVSFDLELDHPDLANFGIDLFAKFGSARLVRLEIDRHGIHVNSATGQLKVGTFEPNELKSFRIDTDTPRKVFSLALNGKKVLTDAPFAEPASEVHRITFRTGKFRGIGGANPVPPVPTAPSPALCIAYQAFPFKYDANVQNKCARR